MRFSTKRRTGILVKRYKRFLADILLGDDSILTVHCPNSGSMRGCSSPGSPVIISRSDNPKRKYPWTLEMVRENHTWIGVNTGLTNHLVREALENGTIDDFGDIETIRPEVTVSEHSRLDFLVTNGSRATYLEVKNCSLVEGGVAMFPDAVTRRGTRHLLELAKLKGRGNGAGLIFCVQRGDAESFRPAAHIDPEYAAVLREVCGRGVRAVAYRADVRPGAIKIVKKLPIPGLAEQ